MVSEQNSKFAPAGFGFGEVAISLSSALLKSESELDTALETIYSKMESGKTKLIRFAGYPDNSDYNWYGFLFKSSNNYGSLIAQSSYGKASLITKAKFGGTWQPLEWVNPRMLLGVEYRTTERWNDKPVYVKLVDCGALPSVGQLKQTYLGEGLKVIGVHGAMSTGDVLPYINYESSSSAEIVSQINLSCTPTNVKIATVKWGQTGVDVTDITATVQIKYTKD